MNRSLRLRLLLGTSAATGIILSLLCVAIYFSVRKALVAQFDAGLLYTATSLAALAEQYPRGVKFENDYEQQVEFSRAREPDYFEAVLADGTRIAASPSLGDRRLPVPGDAIAPSAGIPARSADPAGATRSAPGSANFDARPATYLKMQLPDGRAGRAIRLVFSPGFEPSDEGRQPAPARPQTVVILTLARSTGPMSALLGQLRWLLILLCAAAIVSCGVVLLYLVSRALRPVLHSAAAIENLRETDLSARLDPAEAPAELRVVVDRVNSLLERLEGAFAREKAFTADVAHELRTPLAALQATLQVTRSRVREPLAYQAAIDSCQRILQGMRSLIETLLMLARADAGQLRPCLRDVDVMATATECWATHASAAAGRNITLRRDVPGPIRAKADPGQLAMVLHNLLENAVNYADADSAIDLQVRAAPPGVMIRLSNAASLGPAIDAARLFDRFYRGDVSRNGTGLHSGLGLSLCRKLMHLMGGEISAQVERSTFTVELQLPSGPAD